MGTALRWKWEYVRVMRTVQILAVSMRPGLSLYRLAWRRWPAPGAPELPAARAGHEVARAWVARHEQLALTR